MLTLSTRCGTPTSRYLKNCEGSCNISIFLHATAKQGLLCVRDDANSRAIGCKCEIEFVLRLRGLWTGRKRCRRAPRNDSHLDLARGAAMSIDQVCKLSHPVLLQLDVVGVEISPLVLIVALTGSRNFHVLLDTLNQRVVREQAQWHPAPR
jgi:hypothetical protein